MRVDLRRFQHPDVPHRRCTSAQDRGATNLGKPDRSGAALVTDAEVLQEILHRYTAIDKREAIGPAFQVTLDIVDEVIPIGKAEVLRAAEIAQGRVPMSTRDALHRSE